jgi:hypothetical protein
VDRASVRVAMPWITTDVRDVLAAEIHADAVAMAGWAGPGQLQPVWPGWNWWLPEHPLAIDLGYRASAADVPLALRTALDVMGTRVSAEEFARVHRRVEVSFRAERLTEHRVAERVRIWGSSTTDPRVAEWLALPALSPADMQRWYERTATVVPIVSIVGDANAIDLAAIREHGDVVRFELADLDDLIRDEQMTDAGT